MHELLTSSVLVAFGLFGMAWLIKGEAIRDGLIRAWRPSPRIEAQMMTTAYLFSMRIVGALFAVFAALTLIMLLGHAR